MKKPVLNAIYAIFFFSGAAALIYEVVWVRSLSLVFGGSHLAVTTVLAVFMGGLALGSFLFGRKINDFSKLLRLYGLLEIGIALSAALFVLLIKVYPSLYIPLARVAVDSPLYLSSIRVLFAVVALIIPTTLMGGTLPILTGIVSHREKNLGARLSFLYGFNTLGAVAGASAAGFIFLRNFSVSATMAIAVFINLLAGIISILLQQKAGAARGMGKRKKDMPAAAPSAADGTSLKMSLQLVLWGIGISGFCALGYEVLWTRVLSLAVGASTYGFTIMLAAFLSGIAAGSAAYGFLNRMLSSARKEEPLTRSIAGFGFVQISIGIIAFAVTIFLRDLSSHSIILQEFFLKNASDGFVARQWSNLALAFSYMFVPAFFMGIAFPMAGRLHAAYKKATGRAVGEVLAFNTIGAILGSAISGFVLIYLFGVERSLQLLTLVNIGAGLVIIVSIRNSRMLVSSVSCVVLVAMAILAANPAMGRIWDTRYLALFQANAPGAYRTPQFMRDTIRQTKVLYYAEGAQAIVSSIRHKGGIQTFITNGRVEATNTNEGMQCQYTLGHLPMLLNKNPRKVFVLGAGSGMTLGATSVHPGVERITLAEIEPRVLGVTRTFSRYNHNVLDNPRLKIVFNDGRNYLMTTKDRFDVITADPIHPWFSGAGYLYTTEYFKLAAEHLNPGGIICQWLPIYELTNKDLKSVVKSFMENFKYTMIWMTHDDAELVGSNTPIIIDEQDLAKRIAEPGVFRDLERVKMGSATDFLSYFIMGAGGAHAYSREGTINTDENLYLEFSAPESIGNTSLMGSNYFDIARYRESILPYLKAPADEAAKMKQQKLWREYDEAAVLVDQAHGMFLSRRYRAPEFSSLMAMIDSRYPRYAPWRFLKNEYREETGRDPKPLRQMTITLVRANGKQSPTLLAAVVSRMTGEYSIIDFVDNTGRVIFGTLEVFGEHRDKYIQGVVDDTMKSVQETYNRELKSARARGQAYPSAAATLSKISTVVKSKISTSTTEEWDKGDVKTGR